MKTTKFLMTLVLTGLFAITINSCKKYEDGPMISLRSKTQRVVNIWRLDKYYWNGTKATSSLLISGYTEEYTKSVSYTRKTLAEIAFINKKGGNDYGH